MEQKNAIGTQKASLSRAKNTPDYRVSSPIKKADDSTFWQQIGSAWKKEKGISIKLNALPITSDIMLFPYEEKEE